MYSHAQKENHCTEEIGHKYAEMILSIMFFFYKLDNNCRGLILPEQNLDKSIKICILR